LPESFLLFHSPMRNGSQDLRIKPGISGQLLGVDLIALAVAMRYCSQLTDVRHNDFMAQLLKLFADPDRVDSG
jgi:hypothetical protein